jgi:hypothetical protein
VRPKRRGYDGGWSALNRATDYLNQDSKSAYRCRADSTAVWVGTASLLSPGSTRR